MNTYLAIPTRYLAGRKLRTFLTMFGIAWGVGSLLLLVALGEGFRSGNKKQFDELDENVMFIWSGRAPVMQGSFTALRQYYLTYRDYQDVLQECPSVGAAAPAISRGLVARHLRFYKRVMATLCYRKLAREITAMSFDIATCMYYTGIDPFSKQEVYIGRHLRDRKLQRALLQFFKPEN